MVRIRLRKVGSKAQQSFRIVTADREHPRDGRFLENLGSYNPRTHPATITVDEPRVFHWLSKGAQPTESAVAQRAPPSYIAADAGRIENQRTAGRRRPLRRHSRCTGGRSPRHARVAAPGRHYIRCVWPTRR